MFGLRAADLGPADRETALVRGAVGDFADEAAVLLLIKSGHWLLQLQSADLITFVPDIEGDGLWPQISCPDLEQALATGLIVGSSGEVRGCTPPPASPTASQSISAIAGALDRRALSLLLAAIAHAAGSHDHRQLTYGPDGVPRSGSVLPPLFPWPLRE